MTSDELTALKGVHRALVREIRRLRADEIQRLYNSSGQRLWELGERYGISGEYVRQLLRRAGVAAIPISKRGGRRRRGLTSVEAEMIDLHKSGMYPKDVADLIGVDVRAVRNALKVAGVKGHGSGKRFATPDRERRVRQVCRLYRKGESISKIIEKVEGVNNPPAVYRCLKYGGMSRNRLPPPAFGTVEIAGNL